jgi:hypothetical protein
VGSDGGDAVASWNLGQVNLGLGHGLPGVLAALTAAWPYLAEADREPVARSIRVATTFLIRYSRRDAYGVLCWPFAVAGHDGSAGAGPVTERESRRQGWCYGTPGVAWQIAEAGRVLRDPYLVEFGCAAMASLAAAWDDDRHLDAGLPDRLGFCHGAAGVLAIADAFATYAGVEPARRLAEHLYALLRAHLTGVARLGSTDRTVLTGAPGVLAVLLSREAARRDWLRAVGLR